MDFDVHHNNILRRHCQRNTQNKSSKCKKKTHQKNSTYVLYQSMDLDYQLDPHLLRAAADVWYINKLTEDSNYLLGFKVAQSVTRQSSNSTPAATNAIRVISARPLTSK